MKNLPNVKLGLVAVSRDCFPVSLSRARRDAVKDAYAKLDSNLFVAETVVENEHDALKALAEVKAAGVNALIVYLGNFGPEGPETILCEKFGGVTMFVAAAEENTKGLSSGRGDAYCGMLNASYNIKLRKLKNAYIPEYPVGTPEEVAAMTATFGKIARAVIGVKSLKVFSFGPRPFDFLACNAPIAPLYDLGIEIQENSELDLYESFLKHEGDSRIPEVIADMKAELGAAADGNTILERLAQYELTLIDWYEANKGASDFAVFANKCWPAFQTMFHFVPCYVNSRLTARGIPVSCEVDIYGAITEYIITCISDLAPTLLDINNSVPYDMIKNNKKQMKDYSATDVFMGFHCGNTPKCHLKKGELKYQLIMHRLLEPDSEPNITRGTLEGTIKAGEISLFRLQSTADCKLKAYVANGEILDIEPESFGGIGVIAVKEMGRFYRHVLVEGGFPHHAGVAFAQIGKELFEVLKLLGVTDIGYNQPKTLPYPTENPFA